MWLYGFTTFLSAFLTFQVQMLLGKYILPWYGGVPAVWATCMLFFQTALLAGYAYAHGLAARPAPATQRTVHLWMVLGSIGVLGLFAVDWHWPLLPDAAWRPTGGESPILHILLLLTAAVGAPFITLAATAPLVQRWFSLTHPGVSPYRLYALSNIGSLAGLLSYPFLIETWLPLRVQALVWTLGYVAFAAGITGCAWYAGKTRETAVGQASDEKVARLPASQWLLWFSLAACGSMLLLAITNQVTQEIAVVPFLWMLPLALYLLSFILCFAGDQYYTRHFYLPVSVAALVLITLAIQRGVGGPFVPQVIMYAAALFVLCMVCHGELVRLKPHPRHLTVYYLSISAGGAAGGVFVALIAPLLFAGLWELSISLVFFAALLVVLLWRDTDWKRFRGSSRVAYGLLASGVALVLLVYSDQLLTHGDTWWPWAATRPVLMAGLLMGAVATVGMLHRLRQTMAHRLSLGQPLRTLAIVVAVLLFADVHLDFIQEAQARSMEVSRNFFGVLRVDADSDDDNRPILKLRHGRTVHGIQYLDADLRDVPISYYGDESGIGLAVTGHPRWQLGRPLHVGVVGLGTGTMAAYGRTGDVYRFYEIDPDVVRLAAGPEAPFSYIRRSLASTEIILGDARLALEREETQDYDLLVVDAFSSGSIPAHLLTREAFATYLRHLESRDGILAMHVSNRFLDLEPLVAALAREQGFAAGVVRVREPLPSHLYSSTWVLITSREESLPRQAERLTVHQEKVWTDDYSNLFQAIRWSRDGRKSPEEVLKQISDDALLIDPGR